MVMTDKVVFSAGRRSKIKEMQQSKSKLEPLLTSSSEMATHADLNSCFRLWGIPSRG
jgi:hypothetical protein